MNGDSICTLATLAKVQGDGQLVADEDFFAEDLECGKRAQRVRVAVAASADVAVKAVKNGGTPFTIGNLVANELKVLEFGVVGGDTFNLRLGADATVTELKTDELYA
jgi:hypothetical protein